MTVVLELTPELSERVRQGLDRHDPEAIRSALFSAIDPTVELLLSGDEVSPSEPLSLEEFERLADELADAFSGPIPPHDRDLSREGIYGDHW